MCYDVLHDAGGKNSSLSLSDCGKLGCFKRFVGRLRITVLNSNSDIINAKFDYLVRIFFCKYDVSGFSFCLFDHNVNIKLNYTPSISKLCDI